MAQLKGEVRQLQTEVSIEKKQREDLQLRLSAKKEELEVEFAAKREELEADDKSRVSPCDCSERLPFVDISIRMDQFLYFVCPVQSFFLTPHLHHPASCLDPDSE
ncbi:hypothetical protein CK203_107535 [Vitis vinifera]|uniref:Uncharacterized protein n=1 Tax=Vitis vinifera TaxID=29760 RepID=A0A438CCU3_VITVI|nr:hypothetical protein CK203_107535 [Vitis vinifera]